MSETGNIGRTVEGSGVGYVTKSPTVRSPDVLEVSGVIERVHRGVFNGESLCVGTESGVRILTHCLHPSFEQVAVYVREAADGGFIVHDDGGAATVSLRHGCDEATMPATLNLAAARFGVGVDGAAITANPISDSWLQSAVLAVANASAMASALMIERQGGGE